MSRKAESDGTMPARVQTVPKSKSSAVAIGSLWLRVKSVKELSVLAMVVILFVALSFLSPFFLTSQNLRTLAIGLAAEGIIVVGMTIALASGGFDLSVGSVMGLSSIVAAYLYTQEIDIWLAASAGLISGVVVGLVNGALISRVGVNPFITTLGTLTVARGLVFVISDGSSLPITGASDGFMALGRGELAGIPIIVLIFAIIAAIGDYLLRNAAPLRRVFYVGSNIRAATLSGINVPRVQMMVYVISATLAAVAGLLALARFGVGTPAMGTGVELRVIAAAVIGGASIAGGMGTVFGSVLGITLLALINNALVLLHVSVNWQNAIFGAILIVAVSADLLSKRRHSSGKITRIDEQNEKLTVAPPPTRPEMSTNNKGESQ